MTELFLGVLAIVALKRYCALGNWVWWVLGICVALDIGKAMIENLGEPEK